MVSEHCPGFRQFIDVGRMDIICAIASQFRPEIVDTNEEDVGMCGEFNFI
jgi:hypothetical protein